MIKEKISFVCVVSCYKRLPLQTPTRLPWNRSWSGNDVLNKSYLILCVVCGKCLFCSNNGDIDLINNIIFNKEVIGRFGKTSLRN